jgi:hypothetical protein
MRGAARYSSLSRNLFGKEGSMNGNITLGRLGGVQIQIN